jgi:hypothetical protein
MRYLLLLPLLLSLNLSAQVGFFNLANVGAMTTASTTPPPEYYFYDDFSQAVGLGSLNQSTNTGVSTNTFIRVVTDPSNSWQVATATRFISIGDSKTAGGLWQAYLGTNGNAYWEHNAGGRLALAGQGIQWVSNNIGSWLTTNNTANGVNPDVILLNSSVNDVWMNPGSLHIYTNSLTNVLYRLNTNWPSAKIYCVSFWKSNFNVECRALNTAKSNVVDWLNTFSSYAFNGPNEEDYLSNSWNGSSFTFTTDGVHYSATGNKEHARQWMLTLGASQNKGEGMALYKMGESGGSAATLRYTNSLGIGQSNGIVVHLKFQQLSWAPAANDLLTYSGTTLKHGIGGNQAGNISAGYAKFYSVSATNMLDVVYDFIFVLRSTGCYSFIKGGQYANCTLMNVDFNQTGANRVGLDMSGMTRVSKLYVPKTLYTVSPVASDSFVRANGAIGTTDGRGHVELSGGSGVSWTGSTWAINNNKATNNPSSATATNEWFATIDAGTKYAGVSANFLRGSATEICGLVAHYVDISNYIVAYHDGAGKIKMDTVVNGNATNVIAAAGTYGDGATMFLITSPGEIRLNYGTVYRGIKSGLPSVLDNSTKFGLFAQSTNAQFTNFVIWPRGEEGQWNTLTNL